MSFYKLFNIHKNKIFNGIKFKEIFGGIFYKIIKTTKLHLGLNITDKTFSFYPFINIHHSVFDGPNIAKIFIPDDAVVFINYNYFQSNKIYIDSYYNYYDGCKIYMIDKMTIMQLKNIQKIWFIFHNLQI